MWGMAWFPRKEDVDAPYVATSLLYLGASPPFWDVKKKVIDNGISASFRNMRQIGNEVKGRCASRVMHAYHIGSLLELSRSDMFKIFCDAVDIELREHESFQKHYREFKEKIKELFSISADVSYHMSVEAGEKDSSLIFSLYMTLEHGASMFESSVEFWDNLVYYFSRWNPPLFFVKNFPPD